MNPRLHEIRERIATHVELMVSVLDIIDADPDLEPSLGWNSFINQLAIPHDGLAADDREEDDDREADQAESDAPGYDIPGGSVLVAEG